MNRLNGWRNPKSTNKKRSASSRFPLPTEWDSKSRAHQRPLNSTLRVSRERTASTRLSEGQCMKFRWLMAPLRSSRLLSATGALAEIQRGSLRSLTRSVTTKTCRCPILVHRMPSCSLGRSEGRRVRSSPGHRSHSGDLRTSRG